MNRTSFLAACALALALLPVVPAVSADAPTAGAAPSLVPASWLVLGPDPLPLPALHDEKPGSFAVEDLLKQDLLPRDFPWPAAGDAGAWFGAKPKWAVANAGEGGLVGLAAPAGKVPAAAFLAVYLRTDRFRVLDLEVLGSHPRRAWLDGEPVVTGGTATEGSGSEAKGKLKLVTGTHALLLESVYDPAREAAWTLGATVRGGDKADARIDGLDASTDPTRDLDILDVLDTTQVSSLALSPDGTRLAVAWSRVPAGTDESESWVEIRAVSDGTIRQSWRGAAIAQVSFSPDGTRLAYVTQDKGSGDKKTWTLWIAEIATGAARPLLERAENFGSYDWASDGNRIVYGTVAKAEADKRGLKLHEGLLDRQAGWRDKTYLSVVTVPDGVRRRLTAGALTTSLLSISPDGKRLLFLREVEDVTHRPYSRKELWELDLDTIEARKLRDGWFLNGAQYAPDGKRLLVEAGPSEFDGAGMKVPAGTIPNDYDTELYVWDPSAGAVDAITRDFDPAVASARWSRADGNVYLTATEKDGKTLWRWEPASKRFTRLEAGADVVQDVAFAERARIAAVTASSPWDPESLQIVDLVTGKARTLSRHAATALARTRKGSVEPFVFKAASGRTVDGRFYLPPGFDPKRAEKYPLIVYYYGGTTPVTREWGGRYPKEWWAAQGYVVYVPQPTGATGYGQALSSAHVNDWGEITAEEIIEGTKKFLEAHPFVDAKHVGCIGASYGGFMTMQLVTKTDIFAAAVSHAGISQLSSYWGEGYWGYSYSAVATANSFPWNRKDIYAERSPLFRADKAKTPILMTHGGSDTNVPVGESDGFYVAMKLLGVPAEFLEVDGEDHWILTHAKRVVWSRSIVAWFDKWLKGRPEWWEDLYPKK